MLGSGVPEGLRRWLYLAHPRGELAGADLRWNGTDDFDVDAMLHGASFRERRISCRASSVSTRSCTAMPARCCCSCPSRRCASTIRACSASRFCFRNSTATSSRSAPTMRGASRPIASTFEGARFRRRVARRRRDPGRSLAPAARSLCARLARRRHRGEALLADQRDAAGGGRSSSIARSSTVSSTAAACIVRGDLDSWPFHDNAGRFEARGHIADTTFDYNEEWPRAEHIDATANFINDSMQVEARIGRGQGQSRDRRDRVDREFRRAGARSRREGRRHRRESARLPARDADRQALRRHAEGSRDRRQGRRSISR